MNKIYSFAIALCVGVTALAQSNEQIQNKKGVDIMPVKGEFAVGIGMPLSTITGYLGNMFSYTGNNNIGTTWANNPTFGSGTSVFGKYMISDNNAIRASFYNSGYDNVTNYDVFDDRANSPDSTVVDRYRNSGSTTYLSAGYEFRRGKTRLRGVFGGEAILSWSNSHRHFTYGNSLDASNLTPTTSIGYMNSNFGRIVEEKNASTFGIGVRGFVGAEYFVAPKICIGTEFGWRVMMSKSGNTNYTYEKFDPFADAGNGQVVSHTETSIGGRSLSSGLDNFNTQVYFHFYF